MVGQLWYKIVVGRTGHVGNVAPASVFEHAGTADHGVGVDIDGIDGVGHGHGVIPSEQLLNVTRVALGTVVDEHLVAVEMDAARKEVVAQDGVAQEVVAVLGAVAAEGGFDSHLVGSLMHGLDDGGAKRLRDVANAKADDAHLGMLGLEGVNALGHIGEKVAPRKLQIMFVY